MDLVGYKKRSWIATARQLAALLLLYRHTSCRSKAGRIFGVREFLCLQLEFEVVDGQAIRISRRGYSIRSCFNISPLAMKDERVSVFCEFLTLQENNSCVARKR